MEELVLAMAGAPGQTTGGSGQAIGMFITLGLMVLVFYLLLIRPQRKEQMRQQEMLKNLKKNDRVVTTGGIIGRIVQLSEDTIILEVGNKVRLEVLRSAVRGLQTGESETKEA